jgi:hypothetical protein
VPTEPIKCFKTLKIDINTNGVHGEERENGDYWQTQFASLEISSVKVDDVGEKSLGAELTK